MIITSSLEKVHGPLDTVHLKSYVFPLIPLKVEVGLEAFVKEPPVPETILHKPVPTVGVLPANVTEVNPQVEASV